MSPDSAEAKQIPDITDAEGSAHAAPATPADPAIFAEKIPITSLPPAPMTNSDGTSRNDTHARGPGLIERTASFFFKILLIGTVFFAVGAAITVTVLMDLLDLKTGWIKAALQFIKEASKFIK